MSKIILSDDYRNGFTIEGEFSVSSSSRMLAPDSVEMRAYRAFLMGLVEEACMIKERQYAGQRFDDKKEKENA